MTKRRLIKKLKIFRMIRLKKKSFSARIRTRKIISGIKPEQQEKEMATLRERLTYYQKKKQPLKTSRRK